MDKLKDASSNAELIECYNDFQRNTDELLQKASRRQNDLKDPKLRDELAAARATLKRSSAMLLTASKVKKNDNKNFQNHLKLEISHAYVLDGLINIYI